jgi:hypothetical protein
MPNGLHPHIGTAEAWLLQHFIVIAGIGPPVRRGLSGSRDQPRDEHEESNLLSGTHERRRERAKRLPHHDKIGAIADGGDDGVGIIRKPGCIVLARKVGRHDILSAAAQVGLNKVPIPAHVSGTMNQDERGHCFPSIQISRLAISGGSLVHGRIQTLQLRDDLARFGDSDQGFAAFGVRTWASAQKPRRARSSARAASTAIWPWLGGSRPRPGW